MAKTPKRKLNKDLHHAAEDGEVDTVRSLLAEGADPNSPGFLGATVLWSALFFLLEHPSRPDAYALTLEMVQLLLDAGADPAMPAAIHAVASAAEQDNPTILQVLLDHGASGYEQAMPLKKKDIAKLGLEDEFVPDDVELIAPMESAISHNRLGALRCLLDKGVDPNHGILIQGKPGLRRYPLWHAIEKKAGAELVALLLERGAKTEQADAKPVTAFWYAYDRNRPDLVDLMRGRAQPLRGQLGFLFAKDEEAAAYLQRCGLTAGVAVHNVGRGMAADVAGILVGDVVVGAGGRVIASDQDLLDVLNGVTAFSRLELVVQRGAEKLQLDVELLPVSHFVARY